MPTFSRRKFLAGLAATPLAAGLNTKGVFGADTSGKGSSKKRRGALDVAIVGAGVSGLYTAWRLLSDRDSPANNVRVFEGGDYVGGRLLSVLSPRIPNMVAE